MKVVEVELFRSPSASGTKDWAIAMTPNGGKVSVFFGKTGGNLQERQIPVSQSQSKRNEKMNKGYQLILSRWEVVITNGQKTLRKLSGTVSQPANKPVSQPVKAKAAPEIDLLAIMESESDLDAGLV